MGRNSNDLPSARKERAILSFTFRSENPSFAEVPVQKAIFALI
jgi:hypothetical protein